MLLGNWRAHASVGLPPRHAVEAHAVVQISKRLGRRRFGAQRRRRRTKDVRIVVQDFRLVVEAHVERNILKRRQLAQIITISQMVVDAVARALAIAPTDSFVKKVFCYDEQNAMQMHACATSFALFTTFSTLFLKRKYRRMQRARVFARARRAVFQIAQLGPRALGPAAIEKEDQNVLRS